MPNAIFSVHDKTDIEIAGSILESRGFDIFATQGTLRYLMEHHIKAYPIEDYCLNPKGIEDYFSSLSFNSMIGVLTDQSRQLDNLLIKKIDIVIYNFVPTWDIITDIQDFNIKNVDFGGPTIVRAAAINYKNTIPLISPSQYSLLEKLDTIDMQTRIALAKEAFDYCSWYDQQLSQFLVSFCLSESMDYCDLKNAKSV